MTLPLLDAWYDFDPFRDLYGWLDDCSGGVWVQSAEDLARGELTSLVSAPEVYTADPDTVPTYFEEVHRPGVVVDDTGPGEVVKLPTIPSWAWLAIAAGAAWLLFGRGGGGK